MSTDGISPNDDVLEAMRLMLAIQAEVSRADIEALQLEFSQAGDHESANICRDALGGDQDAWYTCGEHILDTRADPQDMQR
jgi:hypothetical protein